jgi:hypothetical protein
MLHGIRVVVDLEYAAGQTQRVCEMIGSYLDIGLTDCSGMSQHLKATRLRLRVHEEVLS